VASREIHALDDPFKFTDFGHQQLLLTRSAALMVAHLTLNRRGLYTDIYLFSWSLLRSLNHLVMLLDQWHRLIPVCHALALEK
jgi:hypothetical protein